MAITIQMATRAGVLVILTGLLESHLLIVQAFIFSNNTFVTEVIDLEFKFFPFLSKQFCMVSE